MNTAVSLWVAAPILGTAVIVQWTLLRTKYRSELTKQHARHVQQQQTTSHHMEQAKRQIGQLQYDLAAARLQLKQFSSRASPPQGDSGMKEALNRMLDDASASRRHLPIDGFADTQPSPHSQHDIDLLLRLDLHDGTRSALVFRVELSGFDSAEARSTLCELRRTQAGGLDPPRLVVAQR